MPILAVHSTSRPAYLPRAAPWLARFVASTRADRIDAAAAGLAALHAGAVEKHVALTRELGIPEILAQRGHLHLYPDQKSLDKDASAWAFRKRFGFDFEQLDRAGIVALEPQVGSRYQLGMFLADHATVLNPFRYVQAIVKAASDGGRRLLRQDVSRITPRAGGRWQVRYDERPQEFDQVVVAAGAWSRRLLDPLGVRLHLESQRGYHVQFQGGPRVVSRTVVLADRKVFVTPMEDGIRVGGTVEIGGPVPSAESEARRRCWHGSPAKPSAGSIRSRQRSGWGIARACRIRFPSSVPRPAIPGSGSQPAMAIWA